MPPIHVAVFSFCVLIASLSLLRILAHLVAPPGLCARRLRRSAPPLPLRPLRPVDPPKCGSGSLADSAPYPNPGCSVRAPHSLSRRWELDVDWTVRDGRPTASAVGVRGRPMPGGPSDRGFWCARTLHTVGPSGGRRCQSVRGRTRSRRAPTAAPAADSTVPARCGHLYSRSSGCLVASSAGLDEDGDDCTVAPSK